MSDLCVYFIVADDNPEYEAGLKPVPVGTPIKIGITRDLSARLRELQCASPVKLWLLAYMPVDGQMEEKALHRKFKAHRIRGEWFRLAPEMGEVLALADNYMRLIQIWQQLPEEGRAIVLEQARRDSEERRASQVVM